ncbi:MAG: hypothetical protein Q6358_13190 [Candidatus Brocadiales bacterium]|nr:hypothetical protein [Candidatus Brocadiales bacterium]
MLNKKFLGIFASAVTSASIMLCMGAFTYAEEAAPPQVETHTHSEKALAPEHPTIELPMCPTCKDVRVSPEKGRTLAAQVMVCPDCKNEIGELSVHHCDKCGKDVLACVICQKTSAELKAATMEGKCPKCKEVRVRPIKGKSLAVKEMKCPDCKKKSQEHLILHCDKCNIDFDACPICKKEQEKAKK